MDLGGAINIAEDWFGEMPYRSGTASLEDVVAANPDVIIAMRARDADDIRSNPQWRNIKAVRDGRVYANPRGLFWWCRETSEEALQFLWVAKTLYPDAFADIDMTAETRHFYRTFYRIELTDDEVKEFLNPTY
jgi:iron complex transport system substrate-binding protein